MNTLLPYQSLHKVHLLSSLPRISTLSTSLMALLEVVLSPDTFSDLLKWSHEINTPRTA